MPFKEKSSYQDNFTRKPMPKDEFYINSNKSTFKNPINPELPFLHTSSNTNFFKPYKTGVLPRATKEFVRSVFDLLGRPKYTFVRGPIRVDYAEGLQRQESAQVPLQSLPQFPI